MSSTSALSGSGGRSSVIQAYRFALDPSPGQEQALRSHAGAARFAWNWALARCRERYRAERRWYSAIELHRLWNQAKRSDPALVWWEQNSKCAYQESFRDLDKALRDFIASKKGLRKGRRLGFPKFKKRGKCRDSFRFSTGAIGCAGACSACGTVKAKLSLSERTFICQECGHTQDRDINAARSLLKLAASGAERVNACGPQARPGIAGHRGMKQEPGTADADKTGTAEPQCSAASTEPAHALRLVTGLAL